MNWELMMRYLVFAVALYGAVCFGRLLVRLGDRVSRSMAARRLPPTNSEVGDGRTYRQPAPRP